MVKPVIIHCDGGARGNPGRAASAFVVERDGKRFASGAALLGVTTNNVAEYNAVILALEWLIENKNVLGKKAIFNLDSELVVKQLNGFYKVKDENLRNLFLTVVYLIKQLSVEVVFKSVPREKNKLADFLVNEKLDEVA